MDGPKIEIGIGVGIDIEWTTQRRKDAKEERDAWRHAHLHKQELYVPPNGLIKREIEFVVPPMPVAW